MKYIYQGEVEVSTEDLKDFLAVAGDLKVKGLTTDDTSVTSLEKQTTPISNTNQHEKYRHLDGTVPHTMTEKDEILSQSDVLVKQEEFSDSSYNEEMHDSNLLMLHSEILSPPNFNDI